jgi:hypothetical protein
MARWDGSGWSSFGFPNDFVGGITIFDQHDGLGSTLVIGGTFAVSPAGDSHIARLGGCSPSSGTPYCFGDGTGTACPCGNTAPAGYQGGCVHSLGFGARLTSFGTPSLVHDSLVLDGSEMPNSSCLYFQGTTQVAAGLGAVFGDGLRCAGGTIVRLARKTNSGGTSHYPEGPDLPVSVRGSVASGSVHTYQVWYRNAASFCSPSTFNLTNGLVVTWHP